MINESQLLQEYADKVVCFSECNKSLVNYFIDCCGGIPKAVFDMLCVHNIEKEEYLNAIKKLVVEALDPEWFAIFFYIIENKNKHSITAWLGLVLDSFSLKISPEEVFRCVKESDNVHHLAIIKEQYSSENEELKNVIETLMNMNVLLENIKKENAENSARYEEIESKNQSLKNDLEESAETIRRYQEETQILNDKASSYESFYKEACEKNEQLKEEIAGVQTEFSRFKNQSQLETPSGEVEKLKKEISDLKSQLEKKSQNEETISQAELIRIINAGFSEQKQALKDILASELQNDSYEKPLPEKNVSESFEVTLEPTNVASNTEEKTEREEISVTMTQNKEEQEKNETVNSNSVTMTQDTPARNSTIDKDNAVDKEVFKIYPDKKTSDEKVGFIKRSIEHHKRNQLIKSFVRMSEPKKQKEKLLQCVLERKFNLDVVKIIKRTIEDNTCSLEFLYGLAIDKEVDESVFLMLAERYSVAGV